jgi:hypothetical protein
MICSFEVENRPDVVATGISIPRPDSDCSYVFPDVHPAVRGDIRAPLFSRSLIIYGQILSNHLNPSFFSDIVLHEKRLASCRARDAPYCYLEGEISANERSRKNKTRSAKCLACVATI